MAPASSRITAGGQFMFGLAVGALFELAMPSSPTETYAQRTVSNTIFGMIVGGMAHPWLYRTEKRYTFVERLTYGTSCATGTICGQELTRAIRQYL